jgi:hypothetical protein
MKLAGTPTGFVIDDGRCQPRCWKLVLADWCRKSFGLCRDFDWHFGWFSNVLQRPQKKTLNSAISQDIFICPFLAW